MRRALILGIAIALAGLALGAVCRARAEDGGLDASKVLGAGEVEAEAAAASAQDSPDLTKLAGVVRWSGVLFSVFVIVGSMIALHVAGDVSARLSRQFTNRRPTIQKAESIVRFAIYILAIAMSLALSFKLDSTTLTVIGGSLAVAIGRRERATLAAR